MTSLLFAISGAGMVLSLFAGARAPKSWLVGVLVSMATALGAAVLTLSSGELWELRSDARLGGEAIHLRLDAISALFLALLGVIGGMGAVYGYEYWSPPAHPCSARAGRLWWSVLVLALGLVLVSANGLHF